MDKLSLSGLIALLSVQQQMSSDGVLRGDIGSKQDGQQFKFTLVRTDLMAEDDDIFSGCAGKQQRYERIVEIVRQVCKSSMILSPVRIAECERTRRIMVVQEKVSIISEERAISEYKEQYDLLSQEDLQFVSREAYYIQDGNLKFVDIDLSTKIGVPDFPETETVTVSITEEQQEESVSLSSDMDISMTSGFLW